MGPKKALNCFFFTNTVVLPKTCEHRTDRDEVKYLYVILHVIGSSNSLAVFFADGLVCCFTSIFKRIKVLLVTLKCNFGGVAL